MKNSNSAARDMDLFPSLMPIQMAARACADQNTVIQFLEKTSGTVTTRKIRALPTSTAKPSVSCLPARRTWVAMKRNTAA